MTFGMQVDASWMTAKASKHRPHDTESLGTAGGRPPVIVDVPAPVPGATDEQRRRPRAAPAGAHAQGLLTYRSSRGDDLIARGFSVIETWCGQGRDALEYLHQTVIAWTDKVAVPLLLQHVDLAPTS